MPDRKESLYSREWFKKGDEDLTAAEALLRANNFGTASFHIQQALEKYLKGYLLSKDWRLRRIHDLEELLDTAVKKNPSLEKYRSLCRTATEYYVEERYPFDGSSKLNKSELEGIISQTKKIISEILEGVEG